MLSTLLPDLLQPFQAQPFLHLSLCRIGLGRAAIPQRSMLAKVYMFEKQRKNGSRYASSYLACGAISEKAKLALHRLPSISRILRPLCRRCCCYCYCRCPCLEAVGSVILTVRSVTHSLADARSACSTATCCSRTATDCSRHPTPSTVTEIPASRTIALTHTNAAVSPCPRHREAQRGLLPISIHTLAPRSLVAEGNI